MKRLTNITIIKRNLKTSTLERLKTDYGYKTQKNINNCTIISNYLDSTNQPNSDVLFDLINVSINND